MYSNNHKQLLLQRCLKGTRLQTVPPTYPSLIIVQMDSFRQRFLQAEKDFLLAARSDSQLLVGFAERWHALGTEWDSCLHEADHDTRKLVGGIAANIEELADDFYFFESHTGSLKDELLGDLEDVFASLTLEDKIAAQPDPFPDVTTAVATSSTEADVISPSKWLLHNLHNPYPPPHVRFSKGRGANCKQVKDWFSKARQRIGWTRLLRDRFAGCRSIATDAAFRVYVRDDPGNPLDDDLKTAFSAIKSHAELVYGDKATVFQSPSQRSRSISPTPSLTFSSSSEDTDDELHSTALPETGSKRSLKRTSSDSYKSPSPKRRRLVDWCVNKGNLLTTQSQNRVPVPLPLRTDGHYSLLHRDALVTPEKETFIR